MNTVTRILVVAAVLALPTLVLAQTSELYLNDWLSADSFVVQNGEIVRRFSRRDTRDGPGMVVLDTIKTIGVRVNDVGREYDLDGNLLGGRYTNPGFNSLYDGATDGNRTWSIGHNDSNTNFALVQGDADWGNLEVLFVPRTRSLGITYDAKSGTLWVGADAPGGIERVEQYDLEGNLLSEFPVRHSGRTYALAWDPADDTLWIPGFGNGAEGKLFQYDKQGRLLATVTVSGMESAGILGATFAEGGGGKCNYKIKKSKAKGGCESCPSKGDGYESEAGCEVKKDCKKSVKTKINCPEGKGTCKIKAKKRQCG